MVDKLQWITWSIMPLVYDESLSYVELLNKVVAKLNEVIEATNDFSDDVKDAVNEWLTANGQKALEEAVNAAVNSYKQTGDLKKILVDALATQGDVIGDATAAWLNDTTGQDVVKTETDAAFANYVKSDEFAKLVESFITELDDIKRGQSLDIKQMNAFDVSSAEVRLKSAKMSSDYSVNETIAYLSLTDVGATLGYGTGVDLGILDDRVVLSKPLYLGGEGGANQKQIKRVADPTEAADAATKKYVDAHGGFSINKITYSADGSYTCEYGFDQISDPSSYAVLISGEWQTYQPLMCYYTGLTNTAEQTDGSVLTSYVYEGYYSPDFHTLYKRTVIISSDGSVGTAGVEMFQNELRLANSFLIGTVTGDSEATYECDLLYSELLEGINNGKKVMMALDGVVYVATPKSVGNNVLTFERLYFSGDWLYKAELTITSSEEISVVATSYNISPSHVPVWYSDYLGSSTTGTANYLSSDYMPKQARFAISGVSGTITVKFTVRLYDENGINSKSISSSAQFSTDAYIDFIVVDFGSDTYRLYMFDGANATLCGTSAYPYIGTVVFTTSSSINASIFSLR